jgi:predicted nuclease of restriction endonuclease-like RecB superfamily
VARLLDSIRGIETAWKVSAAVDILHLPGVGLCVPDLVFAHEATGECVYLEVLGFWSRAAVWRRVELVERGLGHPILFAVSERLRVSEEALGSELPGALYVYKRALVARSVLERVEALAQRAAARGRSSHAETTSGADEDRA